MEAPSCRLFLNQAFAAKREGNLAEQLWFLEQALVQAPSNSKILRQIKSLRETATAEVLQKLEDLKVTKTARQMPQQQQQQQCGVHVRIDDDCSGGSIASAIEEPAMKVQGSATNIHLVGRQQLAYRSKGANYANYKK